MTDALLPKDCVKAFIKRITALDSEKSPYDKFRDFCEMVFCAKAKRVALTRERADELEDRYMQVVVLAPGRPSRSSAYPPGPAVGLYSTAIARRAMAFLPEPPLGSRPSGDDPWRGNLRDSLAGRRYWFGSLDGVPETPRRLAIAS